MFSSRRELQTGRVGYLHPLTYLTPPFLSPFQNPPSSSCPPSYHFSLFFLYFHIFSKRVSRLIVKIVFVASSSVSNVSIFDIFSYFLKKRVTEWQSLAIWFVHPLFLLLLLLDLLKRGESSTFLTPMKAPLLPETKI